MYVTFTHVGKEVYHVTKLFKKLNVGFAFKTDNNLGKCLSKLHGSTTYSKYQNSGVYQLQCPDCSLGYTGQTGRRFKIRYRQHPLSCRIGDNKSTSAQHVIKNDHNMGKTEDIMKVVYKKTKSRHLDKMGKYYKYKETKKGTQINDKNMVMKNRIFDTVVKFDTQQLA
jgi:hypothetical protein